MKVAKRSFLATVSLSLLLPALVFSSSRDLRSSDIRKLDEHLHRMSIPLTMTGGLAISARADGKTGGIWNNGAAYFTGAGHRYQLTSSRTREVLLDVSGLHWSERNQYYEASSARISLMGQGRCSHVRFSAPATVTGHIFKGSYAFRGAITRLDVRYRTIRYNSQTCERTNELGVNTSTTFTRNFTPGDYVGAVDEFQNRHSALQSKLSVPMTKLRTEVSQLRGKLARLKGMGVRYNQNDQIRGRFEALVGEFERRIKVLEDFAEAVPDALNRLRNRAQGASRVLEGGGVYNEEHFPKPDVFQHAPGKLRAPIESAYRDLITLEEGGVEVIESRIDSSRHLSKEFEKVFEAFE